MTLARTWSSFIWTWPTATPKQRTFFSWNLMVERTSVSLFWRSSACETGVGNLPAVEARVSMPRKSKHYDERTRTLGETRAEETRDLLDEGLRGEEGVVLLGELLDELLVLIELFQVVDGLVLKVDLLRTVDVGGVGENADGHARAGDVGEPGFVARGLALGQNALRKERGLT